jgi:hypothetical protein
MLRAAVARRKVSGRDAVTARLRSVIVVGHRKRRPIRRREKGEEVVDGRKYGSRAPAANSI